MDFVLVDTAIPRAQDVTLDKLSASLRLRFLICPMGVLEVPT